MSLHTILGSVAIEGNGARFVRLLSRIELTTTQKSDASARHNSVRANLEYEFEGAKTFIVGSYGKNTSIRPPSDLDIMLVLPNDIYQKYDSLDYFFRKAQTEFLQDIKRRIQKHYPYTEMKADGQVIVINFSGSFSVEIVPCFKLSEYSQTYRYADTRNGGQWRTTDPVGEAKSLIASNKATQGNTIKLIKMLKCWKRFCNIPIKSFHLEILAQDFLYYNNVRYKPNSSLHFDCMVKDFFEWLSNKHSIFGNSITHPSSFESIDIGDNWKSKTETAILRSKKAIQYAKNGSQEEAKSEWQKIFGMDFIG